MFSQKARLRHHLQAKQNNGLHSSVILTISMQLYIQAAHDGGPTLAVSGTISVFSYTQAIPTGPTGPQSPVPPGANEFALRFVNHDTTNPPLELGIFYQDVPGTTGYHMAPSGNANYPSQVNINPTGIAVSSLFKFTWSDLPIVNGDTNTREIILGGSTPVLNSMRIYISKTSISTTPAPFTTWTSDPSTGIIGGVPQSLIETLPASTMTIDFAEISYNVPAGGHTLFSNQSTVDGLNIPLSIEVIYKNAVGNRRMTNGPLGITEKMSTLLSAYSSQTTGTTFWSTLLPDPSAPARISAPQKLSATGPWNNYMDTYVDQVFEKWNGDTLTFTPISTTIFTSANVTTSPTGMHVSATGGTPGLFEFDIPKNLITGYSRDILGQSGVWVTGDSNEQVVKTYLVSAFARGVIHLQDEQYASSSIFKGTPFSNSTWNDWLAKGVNFYRNVNPHIYGQYLHERSLINNVDGVFLPFSYALSFDDVYNWSSEMTSDQVGTSPTTETQLERVIIEIYENDNY